MAVGHIQKIEREKKSQLGILYSVKQSFKNREITTCSDKRKLREFIISRSARPYKQIKITGKGNYIGEYKNKYYSIFSI